MHKQLLASVFVSLVLVAPAAAKQIKIPEGKPQVSVELPDDWTITFDEAGLQAVSPETNSFVFGKILKRPKDDGNKWVSDVLAKLQARGVVFKLNGKAASTAAPPPVAAVTPPPTVPAAALPTVAAAPQPAVPAEPAAALPMVAAAPQPAAPAPSLVPAAPAASPADAKGAVVAPPPVEAKAVPAAPDALNRSVEASAAVSAPPVAPANLSVPSLALLNEFVALPPAPHKGPHFPWHALPYGDTERNGVPVDVELLTFVLPDKSVFFLLQESGQTDPRMTDIIQSVKPPK